MEIVNSFDEVMTHYKNKIMYAEEELSGAIRDLTEVERQLRVSWQAPSGEAYSERLTEKQAELKKIQIRIEDMQRELSTLQERIQGAIDVLMQSEIIE